MSQEQLPDHPTTLDMYNYYVVHTKGERLPAAILALAESIRGGAWHVGQGIGESLEDISPIDVKTKVSGHIGVEAIPSKNGVVVDTVATAKKSSKKKAR